MSALCPLSGVKQTSRCKVATSVFEHHAQLRIQGLDVRLSAVFGDAHEYRRVSPDASDQIAITIVWYVYLSAESHLCFFENILC